MTSGYGYRTNDGSLAFDGFAFSLTKNDFYFEIVPDSLEWPHLGAVPGNMFSFLVRCHTIAFRGELQLGDCPLSALLELKSDIESGMRGETSIIQFPSPKTTRYIDPQFLVRITRESTTMPSWRISCHFGIPFTLPEKPMTGEPTNTTQCKSSLILVDFIEQGQFTSFINSINDFLHCVSINQAE